MTGEDDITRDARGYAAFSSSHLRRWALPSFPAIMLWGRSRKEDVVQWSSDYANAPGIS